MPRSQAISVQSNFSKGLITEATGLNFPENAVTDTDNCIFDRIGSVERRPGIDLETDHSQFAYDSAGNAVTEFLWRGAALSGTVYFITLQVGSLISFYFSDNLGNVGSNQKSFTIDLTAYKASDAVITEVQQNHCSYAAGNGLLFIAHPFCDTIYITYDSDDDTITVTPIDIKIRDVKGLLNTSNVDGSIMEANHRPVDAEFDQNVYYNLLNQGWYANVVCTDDGRAFTKMPPLQLWRNGSISGSTSGGAAALPRAYWPSEADAWTKYKGPITPTLGSNGTPNPPIPPPQGFSSQAIDSVDLGNSPTGKGHFILSALDEQRYSTALLEDTGNARGVFAALGDLLSFPGSITDHSSGKYRPSQLAFYAGRIWYTGVIPQGYNTKIYFSQILDGSKNIDKCYQQQDPTADTPSQDLLPSDGGVVEIPEIDKICKLFTAGPALYVFATNGIWKISGSSSEAGLGFKANDYTVTKLGDVGSVSALSFVDVEGTPIWWNNSGIWTIKANPNSGLEQAVSLTISTIQTLTDEVPASEILFIKGSYNPGTKIVQWLYRTSKSTDVGSRYQYSNILNLDTITGAFYPWSISENDVYVAGIVCLRDAVTSTVTEDVVDSDGHDVVDSLGHDVTVTVASDAALDGSIFKYILFFNAGTRITFGNASEGVFRDFLSEFPSLFDSYFSTGYAVRGQAINRFQNNCIEIYGGPITVVDIFGKWNYAVSSDTGKWSSVQRVTITDNKYTYQGKKYKVRGSGTVMQFKVTSVDLNPFNLIGWSTLETGNQRP